MGISFSIFSNSSGPASSGEDFDITLSSSESSITFDSPLSSGQYTITSASSDTTMDFYLFDSQDNLVAFSSSAAVLAPSAFSKLLVIGGTVGDILTVSAKQAFETVEETNNVKAGPFISSLSDLDVANIDDSLVVTGGNFATNIEVTFVGQNGYSAPAKSVVRNSVNELIVVRPDNLLTANAPYQIKLLNPGTNEPVGSRKNFSTNVTAGADPVWSTGSGSLGQAAKAQSFNLQLSATDTESITYTVTSGSLPPGLSISQSGLISGSPSTSGAYSFTVNATDATGNSSSRAFNLEVPALSFSVNYLVVGGGGGGGGHGTGGGGGAGGYRTTFGTSGRNSSAELPVTATENVSYVVQVGAGGAGGAQNVTGANGGSSAFSTVVSLGGGGGASNGGVGNNGGSGGGGSNGTTPGTGAEGQGFGGQNGSGSGSNYPVTWASGGGGGASSSGSNRVGGNGLASTITGSSVTRAGGGGGGGTPQYNGSGGSGGGGRGANAGWGGAGEFAASAGTVNTGGGGGGGGCYTNCYGSAGGGSGIVVLRYPSTVTSIVGVGLTAENEYVSGSDKIRVITAGTGNVVWV